MVTGTEQQAPPTEQRDTKTSETKQPSPPSGDKSQTSEMAKAKESIPETKPAVFDYNDPGFKKAVETLTFPMRQSNEDLKAKNVKLSEELNRHKEKEADAEAERQLKAEAAQWEEEGALPTAIRSIQEAEKKNLADRKALNKEREGQSALIGEVLEARAIRHLAAEMGIVLPQDKIEYLVKEAEGSEKLSKLLAKEIAAELKKPAPVEGKKEEPKEPERPDSSAHSAPGGTDFNALSPREQINQGVNEAKRKR